MKNLPGLKILGFIMLVLTVAFGVYAWAQDEKRDVRTHPIFIVRFGFEGTANEQPEYVDIDPDKVEKALPSDTNRYTFRRHKEGEAPSPAKGDLKECPETQPSPTSPSPTPSSAGGEALPPGPKGNKTQSAGAVSFNSIGEIQEFLNKIKSKSTATPEPRKK